MTSSNQENTYYESAWRLMWAGSAMIVLGVALFVMGLLALPAYLGLIGAGAGAAVGLGVYLAKVGMRRQRNAAWHPANTAFLADRTRPGR